MLLCVPRGKVLDFWGQNKSTAVLIKIPESVPFSQYVFLPVVLLAGNFWKMLREMSRSLCFGGRSAKAILPSHGGWLVARGCGKPVWLSDIWGLLASVWRERLPKALQHLHRQARLVAAPSVQPSSNWAALPLRAAALSAGKNHYGKYFLPRLKRPCCCFALCFALSILRKLAGGKKTHQ